MKQTALELNLRLKKTRKREFLEQMEQVGIVALARRPVSAAKLASLDKNDVLMRFMAQRLRFWVKCSAWPSMGAGWVNSGATQLEYAAGDN